MTPQHPARQTLVRFLLAELPQEEDAAVLEHLESGCERCIHSAKDAAATAYPVYRERVREVMIGLALAPDACREAWKHLQRVAFRLGVLLVDLEEELAPALAAEIEERPQDEREAFARSEGRFHLAGLARFLCERCREQVFTDPQRAVRTGRLAFQVAASLDPAPYGSALVADARCRTLAWLANAYRVAGDLVVADRTLRLAWAFLNRGSQDPVLRAELHSLTGSLRGSQTLYCVAARHFETSAALYREAGLLVEYGTVLINLGCSRADSGDLPGGIGTLKEALRWIDAVGSDRLNLAVRYNLAWFLVEAGQPFEALAWHSRTRRLYDQFEAEPGACLRCQWLEARIYAALEDAETAGSAFRAALAIAAEHGLEYETAQILLELALHLVHEASPAEASEMASLSLALFSALRLDRFTLGALALLSLTRQSGWT